MLQHVKKVLKICRNYSKVLFLKKKKRGGKKFIIQPPFFLFSYLTTIFFLANPKLKEAINTKDKSGWTPLHCAASVLHFKEVKFFLQKGADPSIVNNEGASCLHYLAKATNPNPSRLYKDLLKELLKKGAVVNAQNRNFETPLHIACMKSCTQACSVLLKDKKIDVNCRNE